MTDRQAPGPPVLPPLTAEERALVARFPLPAGVPDALVNKKQLAAALDVSATTIDTWLLAGLPVHEKGKNGAAYKFRLSVAYAWRQDRHAAEEAERRMAEDAAAQLRLELLGGSAADAQRAALSPREQAEALRVEKEWILAAAARREFIRASEVADAFEAVFAAIRDALDAAPDALARELGLQPADVERAQAILDRTLTDARERVERLLDGE